MYSQVNGMGLFGMNAFKVTAEIISSRGQPSFDIVGLGDAAVQESRRRVSAALTNCGWPLEQCRITVNLSPADVRKSGSGLHGWGNRGFATAFFGYGNYSWCRDYDG